MLMLVFAYLAAVLALAGAALTGLGAALVRRFRAAVPPTARTLPAISVLKPLYGTETLLEEALASVCAQDYPQFQVVFGVQDAADTALEAVRRARARYPACDVSVVVDDSAPGSNRKVANLTTMLPAARHDVLVIADSDVHAAPDYLRHLAATLEQPGVGLATTLYAGRPATGTLAACLGTSAIMYGFLPGALLARAFGRQDALGATMALRRETLAALGGFAALRDHLADDNVLGRKVREQGLAIGLAATIPATTVAETRLADLFRHELRWGRTIRSIAPLSFAASAVQYPLAWALLAVLASGAAGWAVVLFTATWLARVVAARAIDRAVGEGFAPLWHMPLRDIMSVAVLVASYMGDRVEWRGHRMRVDAPLADRSLGIKQA